MKGVESIKYISAQKEMFEICGVLSAPFNFVQQANGQVLFRFGVSLFSCAGPS